jgi:hypothetical protein
VEKVLVTLDIPVDGKAAYKHSYEKQVAESTDDCKAISRAAVLDKPEDERVEAAKAYLVKAFNYGNDLLLRGAERAKGTRAAQGPAKEIANAIKALVDSGYTAEVAREMVITQRTLVGKPV